MGGLSHKRIGKSDWPGSQNSTSCFPYFAFCPTRETRLMMQDIYFYRAGTPAHAPESASTCASTYLYLQNLVEDLTSHNGKGTGWCGSQY